MRIAGGELYVQRTYVQPLFVIPLKLYRSRRPGLPYATGYGPCCTAYSAHYFRIVLIEFCVAYVNVCGATELEYSCCGRAAVTAVTNSKRKVCKHRICLDV